MGDALGGWLAGRLGVDAVDIVELGKPAGNGYSSETVLFTARWDDGGATNESRYVARLSPTRPGVFASYDIDLQSEVMQALASTNVPVPNVAFREDDVSVLGTPFFVMDHIDGRVPCDNPPYTLEGWILDAGPEAQRTLYTTALDTMIDVHRLDPSVLDRPGTATDRLKHGLDAELADAESYLAWAANGRPQPVIERTWDWLQRNKPAASSLVDGISWGDARISNMIFGPDLHPKAVLDWEMVSRNDPEMDLGWWLFLDRHFSDGLSVPNPPGFLPREETIGRWEQGVGRSATNIEFWEVFAGLRFGIVMIRIAQLLANDDILPAGADFETNNIVTQVLATMLGLPHPSELNERNGSVA